MTVALPAWVWRRVGGSGVVHLVPPDIRQRSRTACSRLPVFDMTLETPAGLLEELRKCLACEAYGAKGLRS